MELEEMKKLWGEMSSEIEKQKKLTDSLITQMIQGNYKNKINKILIPEAIGALVCFAAMLFILIYFQKLNTWYLLLCGIVSVIIIALLPFLSIRAIRKIRSINISANNYKESLMEYSQGKRHFVLSRKLSFYLGSILLLTILPVMGQLIGGVDFFTATRLWYWYVIGFPFYYWFATWVFKFYNKTASDAENILKELESY